MKNFFVYYGDDTACRRELSKKITDCGITGSISSHKMDEPDLDRLKNLKTGGDLFSNEPSFAILDRYSIDSEVVSFLEEVVPSMSSETYIAVLLNNVETKLANKIKKLAEQGLMIEADPLKDKNKAIQFLVNRSSKLGMTMSQSVASFFIDYVGQDIQNMIDELDKLSLFCSCPMNADIVKYASPLSKEADVLTLYSLISDGNISDVCDDFICAKNFNMYMTVVLKICSISLRGDNASANSFKKSLMKVDVMEKKNKYFMWPEDSKPSSYKGPSDYVCRVCWSVVRRVKGDYNKYFSSVYKKAYVALVMSRKNQPVLAQRYALEAVKSLVCGEIVWVQ